MKCFRLTENPDGVSRFDDLDIALTLQDFAPPAPALHLSEFEAARQLCFLVLPAGWTGPAHRSPARQIAFCLAGVLRVEAGDGSTREIRAGDIWRMEDTAGAGHRTTVIGDAEVRLAIVQLA